MTTFIGVLACVALAAGNAPPGTNLSSEWQVTGEGAWQIIDGTPSIVWQSRPEGASSAITRLKSRGGVWRCLVEPSPGVTAAGIWFGASEDMSQGLRLCLGSGDLEGVTLRDASGRVIWQDKAMAWTYYTPYLLEGVIKRGRVRVTVYRWTGVALESQSDWMKVRGVLSGRKAQFGLHADGGAARFYRWARVKQPLSPIVANSPTKLRLLNDTSGAWAVVGDGDWRWTSPEKKTLRQALRAERSTAINMRLGGAEGTWRCRAVVEDGAGGAGMVVLADPELKRGYLIWLGGDPGAGGLMLYRLPLEALWSGPQNQWHYDTEYLLEASVNGGKISAQMLDGASGQIIASSPEFELTDSERGQSGAVGFQTWQGRARFWDFSEETQTASAARAPSREAKQIGEGWQAVQGEWRWVDPENQVLSGLSADGEAIALNHHARGAKAVYRCRVTAGAQTKAMGLLFQVSPDLSAGFECRLSDGAMVVSRDGRTLWRKADFQWQVGKEYIIEGIVLTDRVLLKIYDEQGALLVKSDECWVSDTNNTREGLLGARVEGGSARFRDWQVTPGE